MPHLTVEYSRNIEQDVAPRDLLARLHATMVATPEFPLGGIRVRAAPRDLYIVADGDPDNAFVALALRIGRGRDEATRKRISESLMATLADVMAASFAKRGLSLSVEIQEFDEAGASRKNNLHERLKKPPA